MQYLIINNGDKIRILNILFYSKVPYSNILISIKMVPNDSFYAIIEGSINFICKFWPRTNYASVRELACENFREQRDFLFINIYIPKIIQ